MKTFSVLFALILGTLAVTSCKVKPVTEPQQKTSIGEFTGQWTMDIQGGTVGWLEVRQEEGYLDADLLWIGGSVIPVGNVFLTSNHGLVVTLTNDVVLKKDASNNSLRSHLLTSWLEIGKQGDKITGFLLVPKIDGTGVDSTSFTGTKLPPVPPAPDLASLKFGKPIVRELDRLAIRQLFNVDFARGKPRGG